METIKEISTFVICTIGFIIILAGFIISTSTYHSNREEILISLLSLGIIGIGAGVIYLTNLW